MPSISSHKNQFQFNYNIRTDATTHRYPNHYHDLYEIYFILEGTCNYFIDNRSYSLVSGDIALIPEGIIHNTVYQNTSHSRMLINCGRQYIPATARPKSYLYRNPKITKQIHGIFEAIEQEYLHPDRHSEDALFCHMKLLFYLMARNPNTYSLAEESNRTVTQASEFIQKYFTEDISLTDVANHVSVSPEHFSRLFKKETGLGFRQYLNLLRLQKAEHLLKQSNNMTVAKIATECGFSDSNYFSVAFKKMYGISPTVFLKKGDSPKKS